MDTKRRPTSLEIAEKVVGQIEAGRFQAGVRIIPRSIGEEAGLSVIPVREALFQLVGRGILIERHGEGFYVAPLSAATIDGFYEEHCRVIDRALQCTSRPPLPGRVSQNRWRLFEAVAAATANGALIAVQSYLSGRLITVRQRESRYIATAATVGREIMRRLRSGADDEAIILNREFHEECRSKAGKMVQSLSSA